MLRRTLTATCFAFVALLGSRAYADPIIYTQPSNFPNGTLYASQNDPGGFGAFATSYDNFTLNSDAEITDVHWTGGYFNPAQQAAIQSFTIQFWSDAAGQPGVSLFSDTIAGTAGETFLGSDALGSLIYSYSLNLTNAFLASGGTTYWLSIVPTMAALPQWGWYTSTAGDNSSFGDFSGSRLHNTNDFAFDLTGQRVPEPASLTLLGVGVAGFFARRRLVRSKA
jgi:PEP-CTERM motif